MKKTLRSLLLLILLPLLLISWGRDGHRVINTKASLSFPAEMSLFTFWTQTLADHASDADDRKSWDSYEGPKHYIDIDNYAQFVEKGNIPENLDSAIKEYGREFVYDQGILPWATITTYDTLVNCFKRKDWSKAVLVASDLGHYVADGHMPMHITSNYDGQLTGNKGIHSRYESYMIKEYVNEINYDGDSVSKIEDVSRYVFSYIYHNHSLVDSVLEADNYAKSVNSNTYSSEYKAVLWDKTKGFTIQLFKDASHSLAELMYSAWAEAGKPDTSTTVTSIDENIISNFQLYQNYPNPFKGNTTIHFRINNTSNISLLVTDINGAVISQLINNKRVGRGDHTITWNAGDNAPGIYYLILRQNKGEEVRKVVVLE
ncbi:MAG TPA: T9SS type A sorting domain-containing protein [Bacteroidales bacterium]|nr:T9SS type A sorting domain-containing protein [Bacteroidales bacterium]